MSREITRQLYCSSFCSVAKCIRVESSPAFADSETAFSMIDSTVAVQTKGLGFSFQASRNSRMAFCKSSTLKNAPRRIHWRDNSPNQRSTKFSQLELVGTKCSTKRGMLFQPGTHFLFFVRAIVIHYQMQGHGRGKLLV